MIEITIEGRPEPWKAPKRNGNQYYSPNHVIKEQVKWQVKSQINAQPLKSPLKVKAIFFFTVPKNTSRIRTRQMHANVIRHIKKPDLDNCVKFALDCLKQIVFQDDNQICMLEAQKRYGEEEKTVIQVIDLAKIKEDFHEWRYH